MMLFSATAISIIIMGTMGGLARAAGGGLGAHKLNQKGAIDEATGLDKGGVMPVNLSMLPEALFASILASPVLATSLWWIWPALAAGGFLAMETGHGIVLPWGGKLAEVYRNRKQRISPIVDWLADRFGIQKTNADDGYSRTIGYCRLFMAVKGLLIGLACLPAGILLVALWPLYYEAGVRIKSDALREWWTGGAAGMCVCLSFIYWMA